MRMDNRREPENIGGGVALQCGMCQDLEDSILRDCIGCFNIYYMGPVIDEHLATLLHTASEYESPIVLECLLKMSEIDVNSQDGYGYTPLHMAVIGDGRRENTKVCVKLLLEYNADVNIRTSLGEKKTPLEMATNEEVIEILENSSLPFIKVPEE